MQAVEADQPWTTHWVTDPSKAGPDATRPATCSPHGRVRPGTAAIRACSTTRRSTAGTPARTRAGSTPPTRAREYMFLDDTACNLASINLMKFRRDGRHVRRRALQGRLPRCSSSPRKSWSITPAIPTQADRRQQPPLPPARPGLLEPRQPAHGQRACPTIPTRPAACAARSPRCCTARPASPAPSWPRRSARSTATTRTASRCSASWRCTATRSSRSRRCPDVSPGRRPQALGRGARARPAPRLPQRPGHRAGPHRHDQLHDGLRHHGHRAGHRPGEVQAAGRRRHAEDRQPDRARWPCETLGYDASRRSSRSSPTSTSTTRSKARRT